MKQNDVVIPNGNEEALIDRALMLGYDEIIFLTKNLNYSYKSERIRIKNAYLLQTQSDIHKARKKFEIIFAVADRKFFEMKIDFIIDSELSALKDSFHYRRTSLNQVHAKLAKENNITIVFSFNNLLEADNKTRCKTLGRMFQNARLAKKYKLKTNTFSMTKYPEHIRSRTILDALSRILSL